MNSLDKLIALLKKKKMTIAVAESCSGGYLSYLLTKIPGSSQAFKGGFIPYSLEAKNKFFKIPLSLLKETQGVSKEIAILLAKKVRGLLKTDIGASLVGFAGPETKRGIKIGTVYIAVTDKTKTIVRKVTLKGNRDTVRKKASLLLIDLLLSHSYTVYPVRKSF